MTATNELKPKRCNSCQYFSKFVPTPFEDGEIIGFCFNAKSEHFEHVLNCEHPACVLWMDEKEDIPH